MTVEQVLSDNRAFVEQFAGEAASPPTRGIALVTCMDSRVDPLPVLGLGLGDAHVLRNAGGRVTDDVIRSLVLSSHVFGVDTVIVMQHTKCGLLGITDDELRGRTGVEMDFLVIEDHRTALGGDLDRVADSAALEPVTSMLGLLYDVATGTVESLVSRRR